MRPFFLWFLLLPAFAFSQVQQKTFSFRDGYLDYGSVMRRHDILFDLNKPTRRPEDSIPLDSMVNWIKLHPEFAIEIDQHTDYVNPNSSSRLTLSRANAIRDYLVAHGVQVTKVTAVGYGDTRNIISQAVIAKTTNKGKQDSLRAINRRTEFRIVAVYAYMMHPFLLTDSVFWSGEVLRDQGRILFDLNYAGLRPESKPYLDSIVLFLRQHPKIKMEVDTHTDSRGSDEYNLKLSQMRAQCIMDYLISQGIEATRLRAKGFGETQPIWRDIELHFHTKIEQEEKYQVNRRIEFKIISTQ
jgi:outer membrane protein OmpA-like peptidoglycan-associated protein